MRVLLVDHHDSFTYNLAHLLSSLDAVDLLVLRHDELPSLATLRPDAIVLSPGPGHPQEYPTTLRLLQTFPGPLLGVCLGHQALCLAHGAPIAAAQPVHGQLDLIHHSATGLFRNIPSPFAAVRYHSLLCPGPLPPNLQPIAQSQNGLLMAVSCTEKRHFGVQFHPESISSEHGSQLLENFLDTRRRPQVSIPTPPPIPSKTLESYPLPGDWSTEDLFLRLFSQEEVALWLDTARPGPRARWSLLAGGPASELSPLPFEALPPEQEVATGAPGPFQGGYLGVLSYEALSAHDTGDTPRSAFYPVDRFLVYDHESNRATLVHPGDPAWLRRMLVRLETPVPAPQPNWPAPHFTPRHRHSAYLDLVRQALQFIAQGDSYELCLTNRLSAPTPADPLAYYLSLRGLNPAPHAAYLQTPTWTLACSSPERFLSSSPTGLLEARPIKGTAPLSADPAALAADPKNRSENLMIVDLLRNDLARVCQPGSVVVPSLMAVETYATLHQMVSTIQGKLRPGLTILDALRTAFPGGSMTGAPKERSVELLHSMEGGPRGLYSGAVGYISSDGVADFNIVIRSTTFSQGYANIGAGGAIVALGDPEAEWQELLLKAQAPLQAFGKYSLDAG